MWNVSAFPHNLKILGRVNSEVQIELLQADLHRISNWAIESRLSFNIEKCFILLLGHGNSHASYILDGVTRLTGR